MPLIQGFEELNLNVALLGSANVFGIALQESKIERWSRVSKHRILVSCVFVDENMFFPYCSPSFGACVRLEPFSPFVSYLPSFMCLLLSPALFAEVVACLQA